MRKALLALLLSSTSSTAFAATSPCGNTVPNYDASKGGFGVIDGQVYSPGGTPFIARGINIRSNELGDVLNGAVTSAFPGINFVRINIRSLDSPASLKPAVDYLTSRGIVAELEDHPDGGGGQDSWSGEPGDVGWYGQVAAAFKNNPYVWFGTFNEPNTDNLSAWHKATYDAIRGAGNNNPILIEPGGSRPWNLTSALNPSVYAGMTNVIMDPHVYNYQSNYATDTAHNEANTQAMITAARALKTADGTPPVIIAEFGDSTNGSTPDAGGMANVQSVLKSGVGSAAWSWVSAGSDALRNGNGGLSAYGAAVADFTKSSGTQGCAESPIATPDLTPPQTASNDPTSTPTSIPAVPAAHSDAILPGQGSLTDSQGQVWTITSSGSIRMGDIWIPGGGGTSEMQIVNGIIYGKDSGHGPVNPGGWFTFNGRYWTPSAAPPLPTTSTAETAPALAAASNTVTAPPLAASALSVAQVAAKAATGP